MLYKDIIKLVTTSTEILTILNSRKATRKNYKSKQFIVNSINKLIKISKS